MFAVLLFQATTLVVPAAPSAVTATGPDADVEVIEVDGDTLTLAHLAAPRDIPAAVGGNFRLLKTPGGARSIVLSPGDQQRLLDRRLPTHRIALRFSRAVRIVFSPRTPGIRPLPCLELNQPVAAGEALGRNQAIVVACDPAKVRTRLAYDREAGAPVSLAALPAGAYLGPALLPAALPHPRGSAMTLRTKVGPVTIDRTAALVQSGRPGRRAFARLSDGRIIAARLPAGQGDGNDTP